MIRFVGLDAVLFLVPFALFALWLGVARRNPFAAAAWQDAPTFWLVVAALLLAIGGMTGLALFSGSAEGTYVPPHYQGGHVVPGHFEREPAP